MPFNDFIHSHKDLGGADSELEYYLKACFQLASLHSEMIEKSFRKHGKVVRGAAQLHKYKKETFMRANARRHPITKEYILDPSDQYRIRELISGSAPTSFIVNLEHFCDEFRTYYSDIDAIGTKSSLHVKPNDVFKFIYSAVC